MAWLLVAQLADGGTIPGWFSVVIQGGSFGLLAYAIVYGLPWLYRTVADERQAMNAQASKERQTDRKEFTDALDKVTANFKSEAAAERLACEKHFETLANAMKSGNESTIAAIKASAEQIQQHAERNRQWTEILKRALDRGDRPKLGEPETP